jgi:Tfp pilus assembly protein PilO
MTARDRRILMVIGGLAVLAGFWFLALRPKHAAAKEAAAELVTQQKRLQTAQQTVATGLQAKTGYPRDYATIAELGKALPKDDDLPSLLYQLNASSHNAHVEFDSLVRSQAPGSSGASGASGSGSGSSTASTASAALPPGATVGTAGLGTLPFTFKFTGSYFDLQRLLADVQGFVRTSKDSVSVRGRLLTVDGVSLTPGADGLSKIEAKVVATAYLSPETDDPTKATSGAATGGTTSPGPSDSASAAPPASSTSAITAPSN